MRNPCKHSLYVTFCYSCYAEEHGILDSFEDWIKKLREKSKELIEEDKKEGTGISPGKHNLKEISK